MPILNVVLFLATILTTTIQGALSQHQGASIFPLSDGLSFSIPLMAILLCHEMGHYIAARIHRVPASLPYFVPLPPIIGLFGTMGAVIVQSRTSDRRKLIDIGAAGPLAGLIVAIPVLAYGLSLSPVQAIGGGYQEGNSILYAILKRLVCGAWLPSQEIDVDLHPIAFAGWAGLFVTMLNLVPIGQLDGGHVAIAFFGNSYGRVSRFLRRMLIPLAVGVTVFAYFTSTQEIAHAGLAGRVSPWMTTMSAGMQWIVWYVMLGLLQRLSGGIDHPPVDGRSLPRSRTFLFWTVVVSFVLTFMPVPLRQKIGSLPKPQAEAPVQAP